MTSIEGTSQRALAELDQILFVRLRRLVSALGAFTVPVPGGGPTVDPDLLTTLAVLRRLPAAPVRLPGSMTAPAACAAPDRADSYTGRRWSLLAWDTGRASWRTFRADRIAKELVVSLDTVKKHVSHLLAKLGAANRTEAVTRARELGLIPL